MKTNLHVDFRRRPISAHLFFALALFAALWTTGAARAQENSPGEVLVILASEQPGPMDPSLAQITALRKPPFSSYKSLRVLTRSEVSLSSGKPIEVALPNGRRLSLTLQTRMPDGRSKVQVSINRPNQKDYLPLLEVIASPGEPFFVAGQKYKDDTLIVGVSVGKRTSPAH